MLLRLYLRQPRAAEHDVLQGGSLLQQVEVLEHHAQLRWALRSSAPLNAVMSMLPMRMEPESTCSSPVMHRMSVLFPAPDRPTTPHMLPGLTWKLTWSRAGPSSCMFSSLNRRRSRGAPPCSVKRKPFRSWQNARDERTDLRAHPGFTLPSQASASTSAAEAKTSAMPRCCNGTPVRAY